MKISTDGQKTNDDFMANGFRRIHITPLSRKSVLKWK